MPHLKIPPGFACVPEAEVLPPAGAGRSEILRPLMPPPPAAATVAGRMRAAKNRAERGSIEQAVAILGVPLRTVQDLAARGEIVGAAKIGRRWTFDLQKLRLLVKQKEREAWQSGKRPLDVFGARVCSTAVLGSVAASSDGRLKQMIQQSRKRVGKLLKSGH
jgi:hypothetical protein